MPGDRGSLSGHLAKHGQLTTNISEVQVAGHPLGCAREWRCCSVVDHGGGGRLSSALGLAIAVQSSHGQVELLGLNHNLSLGFSRLDGGRAYTCDDA